MFVDFSFDLPVLREQLERPMRSGEHVRQVAPIASPRMGRLHVLELFAGGFCQEPRPVVGHTVDCLQQVVGK
jgi:hypothetical protein